MSGNKKGFGDLYYTVDPDYNGGSYSHLYFFGPRLALFLKEDKITFANIYAREKTDPTKWQFKLFDFTRKGN